MVKVRDNHVVTSKPAYLAVGIDTDGDKHVLGIWLARTPLAEATGGESGRFWAAVTAGLRNRGVRDILICCCDGLAGSGDAIHAAFPAATVQTCTLHLIRNSMRPVARKDHDGVAKELRKIYTAPNADAAFDALATFSASALGNKYPRARRAGRARDQRAAPAAGTSKWNRIEHRLFSHISMNWRGRPLESHEVIIETISAVTTSTGLRVQAQLDTGTYPRGIKIPDKAMKAFEVSHLHRHQFHGDWNYTIRATPADPSDTPG